MARSSTLLNQGKWAGTTLGIFSKNVIKTSLKIPIHSINNMITMGSFISGYLRYLNKYFKIEVTKATFLMLFVREPLRRPRLDRVVYSQTRLDSNEMGTTISQNLCSSTTSCNTKYNLLRFCCIYLCLKLQTR